MIDPRPERTLRTVTAFSRSQVRNAVTVPNFSICASKSSQNAVTVPKNPKNPISGTLWPCRPGFRTRNVDFPKENQAFRSEMLIFLRKTKLFSKKCRFSLGNLKKAQKKCKKTTHALTRSPTSGCARDRAGAPPRRARSPRTCAAAPCAASPGTQRPRQRTAAAGRAPI